MHESERKLRRKTVFFSIDCESFCADLLSFHKVYQILNRSETGFLLFNYEYFFT